MASVIGSLLGAVNIYLITYVLATFSFGAVQSFVTDLCYGLILVCSLLITVALPHLQSRLRYVSPLLFFVALSMLILGVILHATLITARSRSHRTPHSYRLQPRPSCLRRHRRLWRSLHGSRFRSIHCFCGVVLLAIPALLRALVSQSGLKTLSPVVFIAVAAALLLGVYAVRHPDRLGALLGPAATARSP